MYTSKAVNNDSVGIPQAYIICDVGFIQKVKR
jgi:hypothetical protein